MTMRVDAWARSCLRKRRYKTSAIAAKAAARMTERYQAASRAYYCNQCCGFHLTTKPKTETAGSDS